MVEQILHSAQVKRSVIISNKLLYTSYIVGRGGYDLPKVESLGGTNFFARKGR